MARLAFSICFLASSLLMVAVAVFLRSVPALLQLALNILRWLLRWSYHLYKRGQGLLDPFSQANLGMCASEMPLRLILCLIFSILLGLLIALLVRMQVSWVLVGLFALHGLLVAYLWTDFFEPQGLHVGERMP